MLFYVCTCYFKFVLFMLFYVIATHLLVFLLCFVLCSFSLLHLTSVAFHLCIFLFSSRVCFSRARLFYVIL